MINILLSTYNGERYLREQLDSLLKQTVNNYLICVRDDGSNDTTPAILKEYRRKYPDRILDLTDNKHRGYPDCFWSLLRDCPTADAYAFCDQDDVWSHEKLSHAQNLLGTVPASIPSLYIHDYQICNEKLEPYATYTIPQLDNLPSEQLLFYTYCAGFTMVMNHALRTIILNDNPEGRNLWHDEWTLWTIYFHGRILHDTSILAKYRRHEGAYTTNGTNTIGKIRWWLSSEVFGSVFREKCRRIAIFAKEDLAIPEQQRKTWLLLAGKNRTLSRYLRRLFYPHRLRPTMGGELALRIMFIIQ